MKTKREAILERPFSLWQGELLVLVLLGLATTAWLVAITLSAAAATAGGKRRATRRLHLPGRG